MLLQFRVSGELLDAGESDRQRASKPEADEGLSGDLDLLASCDGLSTSACSSACGCSDSRALASSEDAAEDGSDGGSATDLLGTILSATPTGLAVGVGGDGQIRSPWMDANELDDEQRVALEVRGLLDGIDPPADLSALGRTILPSTRMSEESIPEKVSPSWVVALSSV